MRIVLILTLTVASFVLMGACGENNARITDTGSAQQAAPADKPVPAASPSATTHAQGGVGDAVIMVRGMSCPLCAHNIEKQLTKLPEVRSVSIDLGKGRVVASLASMDVSTKWSVEKAIRDAGFTVDRVDMPTANAP